MKHFVRLFYICSANNNFEIMTNKLKRFFLMVLLVILTLMGIGVFVYYLLASNIAELRTLPPYLLMMVVVYVVGQLVKRFFQDKTPWYGWMYYIGLVAVIIPLPFFSLQEGWIFGVTRVGTLFLIIPPLIEFLTLRKQIKLDKSKNNSSQE